MQDSSQNSTVFLTTPMDELAKAAAVHYPHSLLMQQQYVESRLNLESQGLYLLQDLSKSYQPGKQPSRLKVVK